MPYSNAPPAAPRVLIQVFTPQEPADSTSSEAPIDPRSVQDRRWGSDPSNIFLPDHGLDQVFHPPDSASSDSSFSHPQPQQLRENQFDSGHQRGIFESERIFPGIESEIERNRVLIRDFTTQHSDSASSHLRPEQQRGNLSDTGDQRGIFGSEDVFSANEGKRVLITPQISESASSSLRPQQQRENLFDIGDQRGIFGSDLSEIEPDRVLIRDFTLHPPASFHRQTQQQREKIIDSGHPRDIFGLERIISEFESDVEAKTSDSGDQRGIFGSDVVSEIQSITPQPLQSSSSHPRTEQQRGNLSDIRGIFESEPAIVSDFERHLHPMSEWRVLNVGGMRYETTTATLCVDAQSMLAALLRHQSGRGEIRIDRDGHRFAHVLNYLRSGTIWLEDIQTINEVCEEAEFFQLQGLQQLCEQRISELERKRKAHAVKKQQELSDAFKGLLFRCERDNRLICSKQQNEIVSVLRARRLGDPPPPDPPRFDLDADF